MYMEDANAAAMAPLEMREYRKGNWTLHETVVLIAAKKLDEERRSKAIEGWERDPQSFRTAELRWKWVENHCWSNGCLRSHNQCNDRWDNLLRDYKKVRDYELRLFPGQPSYWQMEKHERKERGLPSNLLYQVYQALREVVESRYPLNNNNNHNNNNNSTDDDDRVLLLPAPAGFDLPHAPVPGAELSGSSQSGVQPSGGKRRKVVWKEVAPSAVSLELGQALLACEEKKEKRHRDLLGLQERRLRIEEARAEICRKGIAGLVSAVNNLANAILALASDKNMPATD